MRLEEKEVNVGMFGLGTVGGGVSNRFVEKLAQYGVTLRTIVVKDPFKTRDDIQVPTSARLTDDPNDILGDPQIDIVVELTGAEIETARGIITTAIKNGKHIVTGHKQVLGEYLPDFNDLARSSGVSVSYEASTCGTIPVIRTFADYLRIQKILRLDGIINGTTNYILTRMGQEVNFYPALEEAQALGVAEADPTADIEGIDARAKLSILATLASGRHIRPESIPCQGITRVTLEDIASARERGSVIKLLGSAWQEDGIWSAKVQPELIARDNPLASVTGTFNSITIQGDLSGPITLHGRGAGRYPTAAAVLADILHAAEHVRYGTPDFLPKLQRAEIASVH